MSPWKAFIRGLWEEVPIFRLVLGLCPTLAVSTSLKNGIGMGLAATVVLIGSNVVISMIRKGIPNEIRIPAYVVVIATFVTIVDLIMHGFTPELHKALGIFIPLIVVNCIILGRAEAFAGKNGIISSFMDGAGMGLGFTMVLCVIGSIREVIGAGTLIGFPVFSDSYRPVLLVILPPGGFIVLSLLLAGFNKLDARRSAQ